ncbi:MAG: 3-hydroxyacyl-CoA dehydrogenase family protein [Ferruginibacter sp.]
MKFVVLAGGDIFEKLSAAHPQATWVQVNEAAAFLSHNDADAFFDLQETACTNEHPVVNKPLFVNSVIYPIAPEKNAVRINAWNGFLENDTWELHGVIGDSEKKVLEFLNKKYIECSDEPGFISPRIIAMIINEACFAEGENVSTPAEIDTAMKLGTNYPYGPFEWAQKIGVKNIHALLKKLAMQDSRYTPAPVLQKMIEN